MSPKSSMRARTLSMSLVVAGGFAACGGDSKLPPTIPPGHTKTCIANSEFTLRRQ
jgi:hypothetical protein